MRYYCNSVATSLILIHAVHINYKRQVMIDLDGHSVHGGELYRVWIKALLAPWIIYRPLFVVDGFWPRHVLVDKCEYANILEEV